MSEKHIGYWIKILDEKIKMKAENNLKKHNLTFAQSRVLAYLGHHNGTGTQKEIELFLQVSHPTVVGIVSRLEENGYVRTWMNPENRRNKVVQLTEKAELIGQDMKDTLLKHEEDMLRGLSHQQVSELEKMLMTIYKNLD